jgi:hypothetical protein
MNPAPAVQLPPLLREIEVRHGAEAFDIDQANIASIGNDQFVFLKAPENSYHGSLSQTKVVANIQA